MAGYSGRSSLNNNVLNYGYGNYLYDYSFDNSKNYYSAVFDEYEELGKLLEQQSDDYAKHRAKQLKDENELIFKQLEAVKEAKKSDNEEVRDQARELEAELQAELAEKWKETKKAQLEELKEEFENAFSGTGAINDATTKWVDSAAELLSSSMAKIDARLQTDDNTHGFWKQIISDVTTTFSGSALLNQKDMLANVQRLVDAGVNSNVELRAFLGTVADDIASTFDFMESALTRLVKLQQADSSAARLGMEADLTKLFNEYFSDTSYLNGTRESVTNALLEATAAMSTQNALEFEYIVQKWMGSLSSLGASDSAISQIAEGIGNLASGNYSAINESLTTLFGMAANRSGIDYAEMLIDGLDADTTNQLLEALIEYVADIADSTADNNVTANAYANILGLSNSDLVAFSNLRSDIEDISKITLSYADAVAETESQLELMTDRISLDTKINNALQNWQLQIGYGLVDDNESYALYKLLGAAGRMFGDYQVTEGGTTVDGLTGQLQNTLLLTSILGEGGLLNVFKNIKNIFGSLVTSAGDITGLSNSSLSLEKFGITADTVETQSSRLSVITSATSDTSNQSSSGSNGSSQNSNTTTSAESASAGIIGRLDEMYDDSAEAISVTSVGTEDEEAFREAVLKKFDTSNNTLSTIADNVTKIHDVLNDTYEALADELLDSKTVFNVNIAKVANVDIDGGGVPMSLSRDGIDKNSRVITESLTDDILSKMSSINAYYMYQGVTEDGNSLSSFLTAFDGEDVKVNVNNFNANNVNAQKFMNPVGLAGVTVGL